MGLALGLLVAASLHAAQAEPPLSAAQLALFDSDHLRTIETPVVIRYSFAAANSNASFVDDIAVGIEPRPDGTKNIRAAFLSGDRHMPFAPVIGFKGNPVLMFFLERDVAEMQKATTGSRTYFRNRIREAFVDRAKVRPVTVALDGREEIGTEVTLVPFREDPMIARFEAFRDKSYRFVLVDAVPGTIYQIATLVPADGTARLPEETTMTFSGVDACAGAAECMPVPPSR